MNDNGVGFSSLPMGGCGGQPVFSPQKTSPASQGYEKSRNAQKPPFTHREYFGCEGIFCQVQTQEKLGSLPPSILESKKAMRKHLAALPFEEKLEILEQLRDAAVVIKNSPPPRPVSRPGEKG